MRLFYILPFGDMPKEIVDFVRKVIELRFNRVCDVLDCVDVPEGAYDIRRGQFLSTEFLRRLNELCPPNAYKILGLTFVDLFVPVLTFVFGQAQLGGRAAVVSMMRLRQEFYGLQANETLFLERLAKEVVHELGHTHGLVHCSDRKCVMHFSNSIMEVDIKGDNFCRSCRRILIGKYDEQDEDTHS